MKTQVIQEPPAFVLRANSYDGREEDVEVSFADLRNAKVGDKWENHDCHNCGRDLFEESAEVVYKTEEGVAVLFRTEGTTDSPNPEPWEAEPALRWFEFAEGVKK